jgi:aspartokinase
MTNIIITENQSIVTFNNVTATYENSFICDILEQAASAGVSIDMISQSTATSDKVSFSFTFADNAMTRLLPIINKHDKMLSTANVKITVKSQEMIDSAGFAGKVFSALKKTDCLPLLITTGLDEIALLVHQSNRIDLERELRASFSE